VWLFFYLDGQYLCKAKKGDSARKMLQIFATNFCSINSFHLNCDQKRGQYSNFTYRPFTLEENLAFAQGVQEMLLQTHKRLSKFFRQCLKTVKIFLSQSFAHKALFLFPQKNKTAC